MNALLRLIPHVIVAALLLSTGLNLHAQGTAFTYQGRLTAGTNLASGTYDLTFTLYNAASGGATVGTSNVVNDLAVSNGLFTVALDFGAAFGPNATWLQIAVRPGASAGAYTNLVPRQPITATPYAIAAGTVTTGPISGALLTAGTVTGTQLAAGAVGSTQLADGAFTAAKLDPSIGLWTVSGGNVLRTTGNVGIGTTTPSARLHIGGNTSFYGNPPLAVQTTVSKTNPVVTGAFAVATSDAVGPFGFSVRLHGHAAPANRTVHFQTGDLDVSDNGNIAFQAGGGNVGIGTLNPATKLDVAGEITCVAVNITSDRNAKEQFKPINARAVLDKVARLPISEWQYKEQSDTRHIGPMAQDFHAAFAVGRDEKHITTVDADGVALAAIQGLNEKLEEKSQEVEALKKSVAELRELVNRLAPLNQPAGR